MAVADSLTTIERNGYTDELYKHTIHGLMGVIDSQVDEAKKTSNTESLRARDGLAQSMRGSDPDRWFVLDSDLHMLDFRAALRTRGRHSIHPV